MRGFFMGAVAQSLICHIGDFKTSCFDHLTVTLVFHNTVSNLIHMFYFGDKNHGT